MTARRERSPTFATRLAQSWYAPRLTLLTASLVPLSMLFAAVAAVRRALFRAHVLRSERLAVPVIVVGNIAVGGTGKTPLVLSLARALAARGFHPGLISRGYGARVRVRAARMIAATDTAEIAGDEPLLFARAGLPIAIAVDRVAAARTLLAQHPGCDVIIADDGLQHYRLARDVEIAVVDGARGFGNGWRLPAGPLREPVDRLARTDAVVINGARTFALPSGVATFAMRMTGDELQSVRGRERMPAASLRGARVHAVAGIGNPDRFFGHLRALGLQPVVHAFPDHHRYVASDLAFADADAIVMTEKDAVKCSRIADARCWFLSVRAEIDAALVDRVVGRLVARKSAREPASHLPAL